MPRHFCFLTVLTLLAHPAAGVPPAREAYPIQLDRLPHAGSIIEASSHTEQAGDLGPVLAKAKRWGVTGAYKTTATVVARLTIHEVDKTGWATRASCKVVRFDAFNGNNRTARDIVGKTFDITASEGRRMYLEPTGAPGENYVLDEPRASILDLAIPLRFMKGEESLDAMFGTDAPKAQGDSWPADATAVAKAFGWAGVKRANANGKAILRQVRGAGGAKSELVVETGLALTGLKYERPADYNLGSDRFEMALTTRLPADAAALPTEQSLQRYTRSRARTKASRRTSTARRAVGRFTRF